MATSKTLTPTNVTIQIPAFADKPDQRVNSNCIDKEADAINALSDQIGNKIGYVDKDISGISLSGTDGGYHYAEISILDILPQNSRAFSAQPYGNWDAPVQFRLLADTLLVISDSITTVSSNNRKVRIFYYKV